MLSVKKWPESHTIDKTLCVVIENHTITIVARVLLTWLIGGAMSYYRTTATPVNFQVASVTCVHLQWLHGGEDFRGCCQEEQLR